VRSILIQLDDATFKALNQVAPAAKRRRTEFIRQAVKEAIRRHDYARICEAYRKQPDPAADGDDRSSYEEFEA
jgi:predicted transcriptional regulator